MQLEIVLASASPRRRDLLRAAGITFRTEISEVDEGAWDLPAPELVVELARQKAGAVAARVRNTEPTASFRLVIGADTAIVCDQHRLGKPADPEEARSMLTLLSGREHEVYTGIALLLQDGDTDSEAAGVEVTRVRFAALTPAEIDRYVATGEPLDKAGSYGIQAAGAFFVQGITGCYSNVVGLPLRRLNELARSLGIELLPAEGG